ncbi:MAG: VOC family protein [Bacillota bacterium]
MAEADARFIGLAHIGVMTQDIEKSIRFYTEHLGFEVWQRSESGSREKPNKLALLRLGTCVVELIKLGESDNAIVGKRGSVDHFAIEVKDLESIIADLMAKGIAFLGEMFVDPDVFGGVKGVFLSGPSGEAIELFEYLK